MPAEIIIRHPEEDDLEKIVLVRNISLRALPEHRDETLAEVKADIFNPDYDSKGCWIAFADGNAVGYAVGLVESGRLKTGRKEARIDIEVLPSYRGKDFTKELVERVLGYARTRGMNSVITRCEPAERWKSELLQSSGFKDVHHWYRMVRTGRSVPESSSLPPGYQLSSKMLSKVSDDELDRFVSVSNDAFSEVFGFFPMTREDAMRLRDSTSEIERAAWIEKGNEIVGFCVSEESAAFNRVHNSKMGYILILCVLKPYRRLGIGAALLADGVQWVLGRGMDRIYLAVDAENPSALGLYKSHGFSVLREGAYYRVVL